MVFNPKVRSDAALLDRTIGLKPKVRTNFGVQPYSLVVVGPNYGVDGTMGLNPKLRTNFGVEVFNVIVWLETSSSSSSSSSSKML